MEISNEIKAKVFGQYLGHKIRFDYAGPNQWNKLTPMHLTLDSPYKLILKPLSAISDEDAIDIFGNAGIEYWPKEHTPAEYALICLDGKGAKFHPCVILEVWQELQNRGFDTRQHLLGGKTLKQCDLCTYE